MKLRSSIRSPIDTIMPGLVKFLWEMGRYYILVGLYFTLQRFLDPSSMIHFASRSRIFRLFCLKASFCHAQKLGPQYIHQCNCQTGKFGSINPESKKYNLLVSTESDARYEWLELAINRRCLDAQIIYLPTGLFQSAANQFLGEYNDGRRGLKEDKDGFHKHREQYHEFLEKLLLDIREYYSPDAVVSASIADFRWHETKKIAMEIGMPWIVTEREGVVAPIVRKHNHEFVSENFDTDVDLLFTSNQGHHEYWQEIGIGDGEIRLTGDLKSDIWYHQSLIPNRNEIHPELDNDKILILYFAFGNTNYIDDWLFPNENRDWSDLRKSHYQVLGDIAQNHSEDVQVIVKGGHPGDLTDELKTTNDVDINGLDNILFFDSTYRALKLIPNSDIIIGFQTTALIESMFTQIPIIYPAWGELYDDISEMLIPLHRSGGVCWVKSKNEFRQYLNQLIECTDPILVDSQTISNRERFRTKYYNHYGGVGLRTFYEIRNFLESR